VVFASIATIACLIRRATPEPRDPHGRLLSGEDIYFLTAIPSYLLVLSFHGKVYLANSSKGSGVCRPVLKILFTCTVHIKPNTIYLPDSI
jgi:hypothetical protein